MAVDFRVARQLKLERVHHRPRHLMIVRVLPILLGDAFLALVHPLIPSLFDLALQLALFLGLFSGRERLVVDRGDDVIREPSIMSAL